MSAILAVCIWGVSLTTLVYTSKVSDEIENTIYAIKDKVVELDKENKELIHKLDKINEDCDKRLEMLRNESYLENQLEADQLVIAELSNNITMKKFEEEIVLTALDREYLINNKYYLKIEMLNHELELSQLRRMNGVNDRCYRFKPLLKKYKLDLSLRSLDGAEHRTSDKARLVLLRGEYNGEKQTLKRLNESNTLLKLQLHNADKICEVKISNLQKVFKETSKKLNEVLEEKMLFEEEYNDIVGYLQDLNDELNAMKESNEAVKVEVLDLMEKLKEFEEDNECYKEMSSATIVYE